MKLFWWMIQRDCSLLIGSVGRSALHGTFHRQQARLLRGSREARGALSGEHDQQLASREGCTGEQGDQCPGISMVTREEWHARPPKVSSFRRSIQVLFSDHQSFCFGLRAKSNMCTLYRVCSRILRVTSECYSCLNLCVSVLLQHVTQMPVPVDLVFIHHTAMDPCSSLPSCSAEMRVIQNFHMDDRGKI